MIKSFRDSVLGLINRAPGPRLDDPATVDDSEATTEKVTEEGGDQLLGRVKLWYQAARDHSSDWREEAEELFGMVAGEQWKQEDVDLLKSQNRPVITFNRMGPVIDSICGLEVNNRQEVQYLPREIGDAAPNEIFTAAAKWARDECNAEDEESDAFRDATIGGYGWTETRVDYEVDPEGLIEISRVDPLEMFWDPTAKKRNLADRRYHLWPRRMPLEDAEAMFPGFDANDLDARWAAFESPKQSPHDATEAPYYRNDQSWRDSQGKAQKLCTIVYGEWWIREDYHQVLNPATGQTEELSTKDFETLTERAKVLQIELKSVKLTRKVYMQGFFGNRTLEVKPGRCAHGFSLNAITGRRDRNKNIWYGVARSMKDPQSWANKFFATILHRISTTGKGVLIEKDAVDDVRKFEENWASAAGVKLVRSGAISGGKIQQLTGAAIVAPEASMMEYAISSVRDVTGVNLELLGAADREQAGILEAQRKQAGMTILAQLFDALRLYRKEQGKVLLYMIQEYLAPGRLIRISGDQEAAKYIPLLKDPKTVEYDVVVDEAPASANQKERVWAMLSPMLPALLKMGMPPPVIAEMLKYSPFPSALVQKISEILTAPQQPNPQAQAEVEKTIAETANQRAQALEHAAKAGVTQAGPQLGVMQLIADALSEHYDRQHAAEQEAQARAMQQADADATHGRDMQSQGLQHMVDLASQESAQNHALAIERMQPRPAAEPGTARMQ